MSCVTGVVWLILRLYHHATHENYLFDVKGNAIKTLLGFPPDGKKSLFMQHWKMIVLNISLAIENKLFFTLPYIFVFGWNKSYEVCTEAHTRCGARPTLHACLAFASHVPSPQKNAKQTTTVPQSSIFSASLSWLIVASSSISARLQWAISESSALTCYITNL